MAQGRSNRGIAEVLVVTPHAVEKHVTSIFAKLGVADGARRPPPRARGPDVPPAEGNPRAHERAAAGRALDLERAVQRPHAVLEPAQPAAAADARPADAVVADVDHALSRPPGARSTVACVAPRVLGHVGERLGDDEIGRALDRRGQALAERRRELHRDRRARRERLQPGVQAALASTAGWMPAASSRSSSTAARASSSALSTRSRSRSGRSPKRSVASCS